METNQIQVNQPDKHPVKTFFESPAIKNKFTELMGKRAPQFITSVLQIANSNALLKNADPISIFNAAATAATLDLPLNNNLGFAYIVPYNEKQKDGTWKQVAQFQMGYKGFIQLAQRSGQFERISVCKAYEGDTDEDIEQRLFGIIPPTPKSDIVLGYVSGFKLINGCRQTLYMTNSDLKKHGEKFSQTFKKGFGLWKDDFESMASKTVLKLLLSKFAPLSVEMQRAVITDQAIVKDFETEDVQYIDNEPEQLVDKKIERYQALIEDCKTPAELKKLEKDCPMELLDLFTFKMDSFNESK